jgi:hypothetical protein
MCAFVCENTNLVLTSPARETMAVREHLTAVLDNLRMISLPMSSAEFL